MSMRRGERYAWCVDDQRMVPESEWWQHSVHEMRSVHPKGARTAAPVGEGTKTKGPVPRYLSGIDGWDRCLGGGLMRGTRVLFTGEPGCGKSTLLLRVLWCLARSGLTVVYITGEESRDEINQRFANMGLPKEPRLILHDTKSWEAARATIHEHRPHVVALDSLQELKVASVNADAGDARQVSKLLELSADVVENEPRHPAMVIIGHIAKDGTPYGAMATLHKITAHLHFKKDAMNRRILYMGKNRQGASGEIAVFEFPPNGQLIREVPDISTLLLRDAFDKPEGVRPGIVAYPSMPTENLARSVVVPIEAFVSPPKGANDPRVRNAVGMPDRAIEDAIDRLGDCGVKFADRTVRLQAPRIGDFVVVDDAAQVTTALAMVSSFEKVSLPRVGAFGVLGPSGNVQPDAQTEERLLTLARSGVRAAYGPPLRDVKLPMNFEYHAVESLAELVEHVQALAAFQRVQAAGMGGASTAAGVGESMSSGSQK